jgi:hypothetical protein
MLLLHTSPGLYNLLIFQFWETISAEHGILPNGNFDEENEIPESLDRIDVYWNEVSGGRLLYHFIFMISFV